MNIPRWGRVVAQPHEYLIQIRNGNVLKHGQGASCFKWPSDSVTIIPTSVSKLSFKADQVTREKVGVEVTGLAVFRIVDPLLAYRMIDLDRASLADILRDMFIGATRRIVASLSLDECLTHRKERVGEALMREIAPVLSGEGRPEDDTAQGWGVVLDTIEIQDVRVLSLEVFQRLQAPYREELALQALRAQESVVREQARQRAEQQAQEQALVERAQQADLARQRAKAEADRERQALELAMKREAGELEAELERLKRGAHVDLTEAQLTEIMLTKTLPTMAQAFRGSFDRVNIVQTGTESGALFGFLTASIDHVLDVAKARGAKLPAGR